FPIEDFGNDGWDGFPTKIFIGLFLELMVQLGLIGYFGYQGLKK
ncbi:MAG: hypothetical protein PWP04_1577, partial [Candidatus Atribacteria bacterium]|nr:hypothetical protein [Candidatus Atribacteria bacterium]